MNNELTIIIKTFSRKKSLKKLLESLIKENIVEYEILILDDSKINYKEFILKQFDKKLKIKYIISEFDVGISKGRNLLLKNVKTPYFLLCDDDYRFDKRSNIKETLKIFKKNKYDILGGSFYNRYTINNFYEIFLTLKSPKRFLYWILKKEEKSNFIGYFYLENRNLYLKKIESNGNLLIDIDIVNNFFIADTKKIKEIGGWLEELKMGEHEEFFYRGKQNNLKIGFFNNFGIQHYPIRSYFYQKYRKRTNNEKKWLEKYGLLEFKFL